VPYLSASAVVILYEEALYQVYGPLPLSLPYRRSGVCRGSDTPTIYVGDIDMYIPLEKPNTNANCMQHVLRCWERQSDGSEYKKTLRTPLRELTALPQTP